MIEFLAATFYVLLGIGLGIEQYFDARDRFQPVPDAALIGVFFGLLWPVLELYGVTLRLKEQFL